MGFPTPDVTANGLLCLPAAAADVSVTPVNSSWADGNWFQISASTGAIWSITGITINEPITSVWYEFDLGVGTVGNEVVIGTVTSFAPGTVTGCSWNELKFHIPIQVASGVRLAVRMRKNGTSTTAWTIKLHYYLSVASTAGVTSNVIAVAPAAADGVVVATNANSWANSGWVQVHAGLTDVVINSLSVNLINATDDWEFDVGVGAASSEQAIGTIAFFNANTTGSRRDFRFHYPIRIFGTQRVSVRVRRATAAASINPEVKIQYCPTAGFATSAIQTTTAVPAVSSDAAALPTVAANNTAWANSNYVEVITSTSTAIVLTGVQVDPAAVVTFYEIDVATGAGGSEVVIATIADVNHSNVGCDNTLYFPVPIDNIATTTRVAMRLRKSAAGTGAWGFGVIFTPKPL